MTHQLVLQPNGLFALFSTNTGNVTLYDMTREEVIDHEVKEASDQARERAERWVDGNQPGSRLHSPEEILGKISRLHGQNEARKAAEALGVTWDALEAMAIDFPMEESWELTSVSARMHDLDITVDKEALNRVARHAAIIGEAPGTSEYHTRVPMLHRLPRMVNHPVQWQAGNEIKAGMSILAYPKIVRYIPSWSHEMANTLGCDLSALVLYFDDEGIPTCGISTIGEAFGGMISLKFNRMDAIRAVAEFVSNIYRGGNLG